MRALRRGAAISGALWLLVVMDAQAEGTLAEQIAAGLFETGLSAEMPRDADCPEISLAFGTRLNRSGKPRTEEHGTTHVGVDWTVPEGTPVVAIADGNVIERGANPGDARGNYIAMEHRELGIRFFSNYAHLSRFNVDRGQIVKRGQVVGYVGKTGSATYEHLHLNVYGDRSVKVGSRRWRYRYDYLQLLSADMTSIDPVTKREQKIPVAYIDQTGEIHPATAKVIWPFACSRRVR